MQDIIIAIRLREIRFRNEQVCLPRNRCFRPHQQYDNIDFCTDQSMFDLVFGSQFPMQLWGKNNAIKVTICMKIQLMHGKGIWNFHRDKKAELGNLTSLVKLPGAEIRTSFRVLNSWKTGKSLRGISSSVFDDVRILLVEIHEILETNGSVLLRTSWHCCHAS